MKIFISQKMKEKTPKQISIERDSIINNAKKNLGEDVEVVASYDPSLAFKTPIHSLSKSLEMLDKADAVLIPMISFENMENFEIKNKNDRSFVRGCEIELLVSLSYGKKIYVYDEEKIIDIKELIGE